MVWSSSCALHCPRILDAILDTVYTAIVGLLHRLYFVICVHPVLRRSVRSDRIPL
jgi:hypothetical protein